MRDDNFVVEENGQVAFDFGGSGHLTEQLRRVLADQRRELREISEQESELLARAYALEKQKHEVLRGIMKTEQTLERFGHQPYK